MEQKEQFTTKKKKEIFIEAYKIDYNVSKACAIAEVGRTTYYRWMKQKQFREQLDAAVEDLKDKIEDNLITKALSNDPKNNSCLIFFCKTRMKERGYVEKTDEERSGNTQQIIFQEVIKSNAEIKELKNAKTDNSESKAK